jgi:deoxyribodipyrimidine photo-lyase
MSHRIGLFLFRNDLRIHDNLALATATAEVDQLICIYCIDPAPPGSSLRGPSPLSPHRKHFLQQSLSDLHNSLKQLGQQLIVTNDSPLNAIPQLITLHNVDQVYSSQNAGYYENKTWQTLVKRYPFITFKCITTHTLFEQCDLPFQVIDLPKSFSKFRKLVEPLSVKPPQPKITVMPPSPNISMAWPSLNSSQMDKPLFKGGETHALHHLTQYFNSTLPSTYKDTRNGLDGMDYSTKLSPWLANGNLSVRQITHTLRTYESTMGANDSTYWIYFELLWREYYQLYSHRHGKELFSLSGIKPAKPTTSFYPERFQKWCNGNTPYPIVNACMNQLNSSGYMSNRGRQLVASCFVHELGLDWRYGAAYMEQQLIDYDVASNWGNWQYLAGVGADPRGHRRFDLTKQTLAYDPQGTFVNHWSGHHCDTHLDSVGPDDWPISR